MDFSKWVLPYVRNIPVYQPGKPISETAREIGIDEDDIIKLASNENPIGVSNEVYDALLDSLKEAFRYPDGNGFSLKQEISELHQVSMDQVLLGNGSNEILELVSLACLAPGYSVVYSQYAFAVYALMTEARGAEGICVPAKNFGHDLNGIVSAIRPDTKLVVIANPNNPTGTYITKDQFYAFMKEVPSQVLVLMDEAYYDYLDPQLRFDTISWTTEFQNLVVCRTLSKAYGLAGLRMGYAIGHAELISLFNRVRQPFNTNLLAQVAALAALRDKDFIERSYEVNRLGKAQLYAGLAELGLSYIESQGNFIMFKVPKADRVFNELLESGIIVRPLTGYGLPDYLRVTIGLQTENDKFLQVLGTIVKRGDTKHS